MGSLVGIVMVLGILTNLVRLLKSREALWLRVASLALFVPPTGWALTSIVPMAAQLSNSGADLATRSALAVQIYYAHLICLLLISGFMCLQFIDTRRQETSGDT